MVQILPTFDLGAAFGGGLGQGIGSALGQLGQRQMELGQAQRLQQALSGLSPEQLQDPRQLYSILAERPEIAQAIERGQIERVKIAAKPLPGGITAQPTPPEIGSKIRNVIKENPNDTAEELSIKLDEAGVPRTFSNSYIETRRRQEEQQSARQGKLESQIRKEVLPLKQKIVEKAQAAQKGIENKENLLNIINRNALDDPTVATILDSVPLGLGKRFLSKDTLEYKAGLVDEYTDLRNIFQGQTRVKELDILEGKLADVYLTDEQKKAVIKSRINSLQADVLKAQIAEEVENEKPSLGLLQFETEINRRAKPRLQELANRVIDEQKSIIEDAEKKKKYPLDVNNSEDKEILIQLLNESGGDKVKARQLAEKKGYKIKKY